MRALLAVCLVGCWTSHPAQPQNRGTAPARAICPQEVSSLNLLLPTLATDMTLEVDAPGGVTPDRWKGRMVVDGTVTDAPWPEHPPEVYVLADGRRLLYDRYNENISYLWEPSTKMLTPLGKVQPVAVGRKGFLLAEYNEDAYVYSDIDPRHPARREVWRASPSKHVEMLGELDGAVVALELDDSAYQSSSRKKRRAANLVCMLGPDRITKRGLSLPAGLYPVGSDALREHRLLLLGAYEHANAPRGVWMSPFTAGVYILDLDRRGQSRRIATVPGSYTHHTAVPHPYVNVEWGPPPSKKKDQFSDRGVTYYVDPATERLD